MGGRVVQDDSGVRGLRKVASFVWSWLRYFSVDWWVSCGRKIRSSCLTEIRVRVRRVRVWAIGLGLGEDLV